MTVLIVRFASRRLLGELSRWFLGLGNGAYVGMVSPVIRSLIWEKVCTSSSTVAGTLIFPANNQQGFIAWTHGESSMNIRDFEGVLLAGRSS